MLKGITKIGDDILIASETTEEHFEDIQELSKRCKVKYITLNRKKMMFGRQKVKITGYMV